MSTTPSSSSTSTTGGSAELVDDPADVVPGHHPLVLTRYPPARADLDGRVARRHGGPR